MLLSIWTSYEFWMSFHRLIKKSRASSFPIGLFATLLKTVLTSDLKIPELGSSNISNNLPTEFYYGIVNELLTIFFCYPESTVTCLLAHMATRKLLSPVVWYWLKAKSYSAWPPFSMAVLRIILFSFGETILNCTKNNFLVSNHKLILYFFVFILEQLLTEEDFLADSSS
jgi:hypothetical protein